VQQTETIRGIFTVRDTYLNVQRSITELVTSTFENKHDGDHMHIQ